jgi:hypothetical protein
MTRPTASEQLSAWIDGELTDAESAELEAELARDPSLRAELEQLEAVVHLLHTEGPVNAPVGFEERTLARVERERIPGLRLAWMRRPLGVPIEVWGLGLAAAAALVVTVLPTLGTRDSELPEPAAFDVRPLPEPKVEPPAGTSSAGDAGIGEAMGDHKGQIARPWASNNVGGVAEEQAPDAAPPGTDEFLTAPDPPPPPDVVLPSYVGTQRWVAASDDPAAKRDLLALLSPFGTVTDAYGRTVQSSTRMAGSEDLIVELDAGELYAFQNALEDRLGRLEFTESPVGSQEALTSKTVHVVISLTWKSEQGTAAP